MIRAQDTLCFSRTGRRSWGQFAADVELLRERITGATHICNLLADRYDFMVGIAAAMLNRQVTVLPAAAAPQAIRDAIADAGQPLILGGEPRHHGGIANRTALPRSDVVAAPEQILSGLAASESQIYVFTSGTTKAPERRIKDWKRLSFSDSGSGTACTARPFSFRPISRPQSRARVPAVLIGPSWSQARHI